MHTNEHEFLVMIPYYVAGPRCAAAFFVTYRFHEYRLEYHAVLAAWTGPPWDPIRGVLLRITVLPILR